MKHLLLNEYRKKVTKVSIDDFLKVYELGGSDQATADQLGFSRSRVYALRRRMGLPANLPRNGKPNLTPQELQEAHHKFREMDVSIKMRKRKENPEQYKAEKKSYYNAKNINPFRKKYHKEWMRKNSHKYKDRVSEYEKSERRKQLKLEANRRFYYRHSKVIRRYKSKHGKRILKMEPKS